MILISWVLPGPLHINDSKPTHRHALANEAVCSIKRHEATVEGSLERFVVLHHPIVCVSRRPAIQVYTEHFVQIFIAYTCFHKLSDQLNSTREIRCSWRGPLASHCNPYCPEGMLQLGICGMHHLLAIVSCGWVFSRFASVYIIAAV